MVYVVNLNKGVSKLFYKKLEREVETKHNGTQKVEFEAPQFDSLDEAGNFYGGQDKLLERINTITARSAEQNGKVMLKNSNAALVKPGDEASAKELADVITKAQSAVRNYKPDTTEGVSKAAAKERVDNILALKNDPAKKEEFVARFRNDPEALFAFLESGGKL